MSAKVSGVAQLGGAGAPRAGAVDGVCWQPADCNVRRWYGAGALAGGPCPVCGSWSLRYPLRANEAWVGQVVEGTQDKRRYYQRWGG